MVKCCRLITALGTATALCTVVAAATTTAASEDDTLDVDDSDISSLLAHRAHRPRAGDDEISRLVADYSDLGTEEELMEIVRKVDARAEMALIYKARRRRGEPAGVRACEMLGVYSDADNYDCHIRRYKMIREQFGPEQEVHDKGKDVRVKANTLADDWNKAETTLDRLMQYTYGKGGTKAEPSTKDGLTHKIGLASAALYELHSATVTAADEIWAEFDKIHFGYAADIDDLKSGAVKAFNSLVSGVQSVVAGQANDQMANQLRLNQDANDKLTKLARGINEIQVKVERAARGVEHQKDTLESTAEKTLEDAEDTLTNIADELAEVPVKDIEERDKVADEIRSDLRKTEDEGEAELKKHVAGYEEKANKQTKQLEEATKKQIENQASDWQAEEDNRRKSLNAKLQGERQELELAQGSVANSLASAKEKAALQEQEFQKKRAGRWGEFQKLAEDIGLTREELEMMVKNVGMEIETGAHELEDEANRGQAGIKNAISEKMSAAGGGVAGILGSLFSALAGAEQDIYGASEGAKEEVLKNIRKTMQENGMENSKMGQVLGEFIDGVLKGEKATAADLQAKLKGIDHETGKVSDDLQGGVMHLVDSLNQNAARSSLQAYGIEKDIEGSLHAGMNGLDGKLAGLSHAMLSDEEDTAGKMNKGLHAILSQIGGVGSSANGLLQSLMGLSHDESQLKGDALDGERRMYTNQQRLARQLAQTLFGLGAQLMQFLGGSESSLAASMHNEDLKARKEFGLLAGDYGLGIKDYEGAGREGYAELQSRLGNEKARARALEGDLKRTEEEMERLQRGEQLNLDDEKKAYENYLSQNTAKAGAELEGIRAKLVGDEGQIEREMRDQMDAASQRSEQDARKRESEADRAINAAERRLQAERSDDANVQRKLEEDSDRFERDKEGSDGELDSVTKSINGEGDKFKGDYKRLLDEFSEMKGKEQGDLNRLTENFKKRVDALPKTVAAKMDELQRGFYASHAAIDKKISELRHQASNAESEEEREAAKKNLEALERMKEFAVKVKEADDAMKAKILRGEEVDENEMLTVQDGMKSVLGNLENIESHFNGNSDTLNLEFGDAERRIESLYSGMGASMTEGMSMLDRERREALTGAQFDTQTSELENKQRLDLLNTVTSGAKRISIMENQELLALEHAQKNNITKVQEELRDIKQGMKTRMPNVMSELAKAQSQVDRSGKEDQADVAFRLGLVRQACAQFIAIWREYAGSMQKKLGRFHQVDMETLELLDQASEKAQADTRAKVERAVDKVRNYDRQLNQGYKEAEEFSEYADEEVAKLEEKDKETEAEREEVMEESVRDLEELEKSQDKLNKEQLLGIKGALRKFHTNLEKNAEEVLESAGVEEETSEEDNTAA